MVGEGEGEVKASEGMLQEKGGASERRMVDGW